MAGVYGEESVRAGVEDDSVSLFNDGGETVLRERRYSQEKDKISRKKNKRTSKRKGKSKRNTKKNKVKNGKGRRKGLKNNKNNNGRKRKAKGNKIKLKKTCKTLMIESNVFLFV